MGQLMDLAGAGAGVWQGKSGGDTGQRFGLIFGGNSDTGGRSRNVTGELVAGCRQTTAVASLAAFEVFFDGGGTFGARPIKHKGTVGLGGYGGVVSGVDLVTNQK